MIAFLTESLPVTKNGFSMTISGQWADKDEPSRWIPTPNIHSRKIILFQIVTNNNNPKVHNCF